MKESVLSALHRLRPKQKPHQVGYTTTPLRMIGNTGIIKRKQNKQEKASTLKGGK